jgi:hypothetical protein
LKFKNQAAADRYYHQLHPKPWAKVPGGSWTQHMGHRVREAATRNDASGADKPGPAESYPGATISACADL